MSTFRIKYAAFKKMNLSGESLFKWRYEQSTKVYGPDQSHLKPTINLQSKFGTGHLNN